MKILFIGDIVGGTGRRAVRKLVPELRERHELDWVIANSENAAGGSGITVNTAAEIYASGVDVITMGDHLWDQKDVAKLLENEKRFVRPLNYPEGTPGQGGAVYQVSENEKIGVVNAQGRAFMTALENPFTTVMPVVDKLREETPIIFVDFHAEATAEKIGMGRFLDGKVSAVVGTHTHVQTADEQIFPGGTAFLCDAGFTGPHESVIGREIEPVLKRFVTSRPQRFAVAKERIFLQGVIITIDNETGKATSIERVSESLPAE